MRVPLPKLTRHQWIGVSILAAAFVLIGLTVHLSSYSRSVSLKVLDLGVSTDEGLIVLHFPMTLLAAGKSPESEFIVLRKDLAGSTWVAPNRGQTPARAIPKHFLEARLYADFGYWKGGWQSDARPGPFLYLFIPVWFVTSVFFTVALVAYLRRPRFGIRGILLFTAICGAVLWALNLHSA